MEILSLFVLGGRGTPRSAVDVRKASVSPNGHGLRPPFGRRRRGRDSPSPKAPHPFPSAILPGKNGDARLSLPGAFLPRSDRPYGLKREALQTENALKAGGERRRRYAESPRPRGTGAFPEDGGIRRGPAAGGQESILSVNPSPYTLKRKCMTSPSCTTYSLPSTRSTPSARQAASLSWLM